MNEENPKVLGVIEDPRTEDERSKDYSHEEVTAGAVSIQWVQKKPEDWKRYPKRNQSSSLSCLAQSGAKLLGVENKVETGNFIEFSALDIYDRRANKPSGGMWGQNLMQILKDQGSCYESQLPSQGMNESQMNRAVVRTQDMLDIERTYKTGGYVEVKNRTIDAVASVLEQGKAVELMMWFDEEGTEWWKTVPSIKYPNLGTTDAGATRHGIVAVDYTMFDGKKCLIIEDSAGNYSSIDGKGQRILTEEFFNKRCYYAAYALPLVNSAPDAPVTPKPKHTFNNPLSFGMKGNADVAALQDILKYEGVFPVNIPSTGNYLEQTAKAVLKWQIKHGVATLGELQSLQGKTFGPKSRAVANAIYSN